ncbi:MAG: NAD(P)-dependent oxidoreductase [Jatrophihabitantaceae bacterium]
MRVLLAGATGVVGRQLVPLLVSTGHEVIATTQRADKFDQLWHQGARPVALDLLDRSAVRAVVLDAQPEAIVHQATALSMLGNNVRRYKQLFRTTNDLRTRGTANLIAAGQESGVERLVVQSYCGWPFAAEGGWVKDEDAPLEPHPPAVFAEMLAAIRELEQLVASTPGGVVLRYGGLYGPGTSLDVDGPQVLAVRKRRLPLVGDAGGYWSFLHVHDAATAALAALTRGAGIYNIVDDEPAAGRDWIPYLAAVVGAEPPRRVPVWLARIVAGEGAVRAMTRGRAGSNEKAERELAWTPSRKSWRDGFRAELG